MTTIFRLAAALERQGMSQSELARVSGVGLSTVSRLCRNSTAQVSLATLDAIAAALKVEPGDLIVREKGKRTK
jgi:transcriptional regulator with XRE-family HTH domain